MAIQSEIIAYFSSLIEKETGIVYDSVNQHLLEGRLRELAKFANVGDVDALWREIQVRGIKGAERDTVLDLATNNETSFFRDSEVFDFVRDQFVAKEGQKIDKIRIWCAACSTGQEPYSLAMTLAQCKDQGLKSKYEIRATDFSERVLKQAKSGIYSQLEVQRGLPAALLIKFFDQIKIEESQLARFCIKRDLSQFIDFQRLNLLDAWPAVGRFHLIFCRNVLIYQSIENKKKVIARMVSLLEPDGYLVLGGAESLLGLSSEFEMKIFGKACVYKLKSQMRASA